MSSDKKERKERIVIFVYGTLKKNQPNQSLLSDRNNVKFISEAHTTEIWPLIIATERNVPYLLNEKTCGKVFQFFQYFYNLYIILI